MPSDRQSHTIVSQAREALAPAQQAFRAVCEAALAQGEAWWSEQAASEEDRAARLRAELGPFADGHVDAARFGALFGRAQTLEPDARSHMRCALNVLRGASTRTSVMTVSVPPGGSLLATMDDALADAGRAFAAARVIERVRAGHDSTEPRVALADLPFRSWTRTERRYAPPIVVTVAGSDLHAGALGDYVDGRQKIVLIVEGPCPPAPLVRLVTPGALVVQTTDCAALERVARFDGPAAAAVVPESAAWFVHDPTAGTEPWQRLSIQRLPSPPFAPVPGMSAWQLREDVRQLEALVAAPTTGTIPPGAALSTQAPDAVDRLASWLLSQSDLTGLA
jgi:hypothetical protein